MQFVAQCLAEVSNRQICINLLTNLIISLFENLLFFLSCLSFGLFCITVSFHRKRSKVKEIKLGGG